MKKSNLYLITAILIGLALLPLPYFYYQLLRWEVCSVSIFTIMKKPTQRNKLVFFSIIAILFNPLTPISLGRELWFAVDLITAGYFLYCWINDY